MADLTSQFQVRMSLETSASPDQSALGQGSLTGWWREWQFLAVLLLAVGIYFSRLTMLPPCGEETRVAHIAVQMMETGDWVVPRQQGIPFPERPPLGAWCMAGVGYLTGSVDRLAMRLPSVIAILLTAVVIYLYARSCLSARGALASACAYLTAGQVIQIGRQGESEPLFALFVGSALLLWHLGYLRGWHAIWPWCIGYSLTALGALMKGPQAPIYFIASIGIYLVVKRDWRRLFGWEHFLGIACFGGILSLWLLPFYWQSGAAATAEIWTILAAKRFGLGGLVKHLLAYPFETLACLLPWSPMVIQLFNRHFREQLVGLRPQVQFLLLALAVTYPSVWLAAGARGRYYMPLYPLLAVLLGMVIETSILAPVASFARRGWNRYLTCLAILAGCSGLAVITLPLWLPAKLAEFSQPPAWIVGYFLAAIVTAAILWFARQQIQHASAAICAISALVGLAYAGLALNIRVRTANDIQPAVAQAKQLLDHPEQLVSLGPIAHQFAFAFHTPIREVAWPPASAQLDPEVDYFCFHTTDRDPPGKRLTGRGMKQAEVPLELPFAWEEVTRINYGRDLDDTKNVVIIGRVLTHVAQHNRAETDATEH